MSFILIFVLRANNVVLFPVGFFFYDFFVLVNLSARLLKWSLAPQPLLERYEKRHSGGSQMSELLRGVKWVPKCYFGALLHSVLPLNSALTIRHLIQWRTARGKVPRPHNPYAGDVHCPIVY